MQKTANRSAIPSALIAVILAALFTAAATFQPFSPEDRQADQVGSYWIVVVVFLVAAVLIYGLVVPRIQRPLGALILGVLSIVSLPVFWLGLTPILGVAAATLGWQGREAASGRGLAVAALVLGVLAIVAGAVLAVVG